jgi:hypothetical protein
VGRDEKRRFKPNKKLLFGLAKGPAIKERKAALQTEQKAAFWACKRTSD